MRLVPTRLMPVLLSLGLLVMAAILAGAYWGE